ncbi:MAG: hypothetical protein PHD43_24260 [Methylococcales bacterium]|nr:hypothetical protein [Methylococcales bacterium]
MNINFLHPRQSTLLALALSTYATLMSGAALAVDAVGGSARNIDVNVGAAWTVLTSVNFRNPTQRFCTATGSADAFRPSAAPGQYRYLFTVSDTPNPAFDQGQERALEFLNQGNILDNTSKEITTTGGWMSNAAANPGYFTVAANPLIFGSRTLYFLARKATVFTPNLTVADASMTVTCTDNVLAPPLIIDVDPQGPLVPAN